MADLVRRPVVLHALADPSIQCLCGGPHDVGTRSVIRRRCDHFSALKEGERKRVRSPLRREEGLRRSGPGHWRLRDKRDKRERSTCAGGEVLPADMDDRVDDSVDRLAQRKRHGGVRIQNRPLREEKRAVN